MTKIVLRKEIPEYFFFFENFNIYVYFLLIKSILIIFLFEDFFVKIIKKYLISLKSRLSEMDLAVQMH